MSNRRWLKVSLAVAALVAAAGWLISIQRGAAQTQPIDVEVVTQAGGAPAASDTKGWKMTERSDSRPSTPDSPKAHWGALFVNEDDDYDGEKLTKLYNPYESLKVLPQLEAAASAGDGLASYRLFRLARDCQSASQRKLLADYDADFASRCDRVHAWSQQHRMQLLEAGARAGVSDAATGLYDRVVVMPPGSPRRAELGAQVVRDLELAAVLHGEMETLIRVSIAYAEGDLVQQDLRKALAYREIVDAVIGTGPNGPQVDALRAQLRPTDLDFVRAFQEQIRAARSAHLDRSRSETKDNAGHPR